MDEVSQAPSTSTTFQPVTHTSISLFTIANRDIYVDGLLRLITELPGLRITECVSPGKKCFENFSANPADLLLIEQSVIKQHLQETPVDELFSKFTKNHPDLRIIIFGHAFENDFIQKMLRAGVHGFIDSTMTQKTLHNAIQEIHNGGYWVSRNALEKIIFSALEMERVIEKNVRDKIEAIQGDLTPRESDVLRCVMDGQSTREIAETLFLSEQTVKLHLGRLFRKFDVTNRSQLILIAFLRVCPVSNMINLFRSGLDKSRISLGKPPIIPDPLASK
ncbi:MAG: hypothetical protein GQ537_05790 [Gammaproteobacteria bacterium]|nr:hypothetical protein [Gammaproteobacteria bacterium]